MPQPLYADGAAWNWSQTGSACIISIPVSASSPASKLKSSIDVKLTEDTATVKIGDLVVFKGRLFSSIRPKDSTWQIDDFPVEKPAHLSHPHRYRLLNVSLAKSAKNTPWSLPVRAGIASDTDADPHSLFLIASARHDVSDPTALKRMTAAGEAGSVAAMLKLAAWYELGREEMDVIPVRRDPIVSLAWHRKAAEAGNPEACYIVMTAYASGSHGCPKSYSEAVKWARASFAAAGGEELFRAEQENLFVTVAFQAGLMLMEGGSGLGDPNPAEAAKLWKQASEAGHGQSSWNLGIFLLNGFGVEVDIVRGVRLIQKGMKAVKSLSLPPQLAGLSDADLEKLVALVEKEKKEGVKPDIDRMVKAVKAAKKTRAAKADASKKRSTPATASAKKVAAAADDDDLVEVLERRSNVGRWVAASAIVLGAVAIFVAVRSKQP
ncbi:hypothetical protein HDU96_009177 [Phlyctochytrium bullatum]|nr:hypothetical protein HDU96_009177 [Phlyctochytrium bullatum]